MPIVGLPDFADGVLSAAQMNAISRSLEQKFAAGLTGADMDWPFLAMGDINVGRHNLVHVAKFWNQYNLLERQSGDTVQDVVDALSADGGGVIIVPGNTVITIEAVGVDIPDNVFFVGHGPTSVLAMHASSTVSAIRLAATTASCGFVGLTIRGVQGVNEIPLHISGAADVLLSDVTLETHGEEPLCQIDTEATKVTLDNVRFNGLGNVEKNTQLSIEGLCNDITVTNCRFKDWSDIAVECSSNRLAFTNNRLNRTAAAGVMVSEYSVLLDGGAGDPMLHYVINNNKFGGAADVQVGGLRVDNSTYGVIAANEMTVNRVVSGAGAPAVLTHEASYIAVADNRIRSLGDGVIMGASAGTNTTIGSRQVGLVAHVAVTGNFIDATFCGIALTLSVSDGIHASVVGNHVRASTCSLSLWNCGAQITTETFNVVINGNTCNSEFGAYEGVGPADTSFGADTTHAAKIGGADNAYFILTSNIIPGTQLDTGDYEAKHDATFECIVADNLV